jgi:predicted TPR repeat methyltransferase
VTAHAVPTEAQFARSRAFFFEGVEHLDGGRLEPGGCLAFTIERAEAGRDLQLLPSLRYAHS